MQSRLLRQAIDLALDTEGMKGPITRRQIVDGLLRLPEHYWTAGDNREARSVLLFGAVTDHMNEPHSTHIIDQYLAHLPPKYSDLLERMSRFICISPRGGRDALHVMSLNATGAHWAANYELKNRIVEATRISRNESRNIRLLLESTGANSIADLLTKEAAE